MSKKIFFARCNNFGDELNSVIFNSYSKERVSLSYDVAKIDYIGIGSILDASLLTYAPQKDVKTHIKNIIKRLRVLFSFKPLITLGAGISFQYDNSLNLRFVRKMQFPIVRGALSADILKKSGYLKNDNIVLGDVGLLASDILSQKAIKKYSLGVVPHFRDLDNPLIWKIIEKTPKSICVNVQDSPVDVVKKIAECERIVSTSLHGLIVADSLHIPNMWLENPWVHYERPINSYRFKYKDYYSALGLNSMLPIDIIDYLENFNLDDINRLYKISPETIENKKTEIRKILNEIFK
ncbi:polysaccharide pyruvyl transferase family protein [Fibrobacter sp. UWB11]|uniref:polysaccharide pyruvyl transferase family protein n=1 Tax=Fibrobacter sp. UWB11 TaxID=1896202 RepID=UPI00092A386B|nr:polysaccharide pyruvyl transferase family protein [Fibrobacter sp. UWB11]SIO10349.1 Polysaccharide pyruvyl transferase [Fibrobacter sp. UWB11]